MRGSGFFIVDFQFNLTGTLGQVMGLENINAYSLCIHYIIYIVHIQRERDIYIFLRCLSNVMSDNFFADEFSVLVFILFVSEIP